MEDTVFTKIIKGEIPCYKVWEDDNFLAFLDIQPRTVGHTLVIPKRPTDYLFDMAPTDYAALWGAAHTVAIKLKDVFGTKRVCVAVYGFDVPHAHIHLMPANSEPSQIVDMDAKAKLAETAKLLSP